MISQTKSVAVFLEHKPSTKYRTNQPGFTPDRQPSKTLILSTRVDQKSLETEFLIAICRPTGNKWQSKRQFLVVFDPRSSIVIKRIFNCRLSSVVLLVSDQSEVLLPLYPFEY